MRFLIFLFLFYQRPVFAEDTSLLCTSSSHYTKAGASSFLHIYSSNKNLKIPSGFIGLVTDVYFETTKWISDPLFRSYSRSRPINILFVTQDELKEITKVSLGYQDTSIGFVTNLSQKKCYEDNIFISISSEARAGFLSERILRLFSHELYHLLYYYKCSGCKNPLWFDEGMAEYVATLSTQIIPQKALIALRQSRGSVNFFENRRDHFVEENYAYAYLFFYHYLGVPADLIEVRQILNSRDPVLEFIRLKSFSSDKEASIKKLLEGLPL